MFLFPFHVPYHSAFQVTLDQTILSQSRRQLVQKIHLTYVNLGLHSKWERISHESRNIYLWRRNIWSLKLFFHVLQHKTHGDTNGTEHKRYRQFCTWIGKKKFFMTTLVWILNKKNYISIAPRAQSARKGYVLWKINIKNFAIS